MEDLINKLREEATKSPCGVIKFAASDGNVFSHNGEFYANCKDCKRTIIEQPYPECKANHAEWGVLAKSDNPINLYIYCMTPDKKDYSFTRFWCKICSILVPMFGTKNVFMWNGNEWIKKDANKLIDDVQ